MKEEVKMITYKVFEQQRKVIAIISGTENDLVRKVKKHDNQKVLSEHTYEQLKMPKSFKVVVKCHESDKFDIEVGKELAKERVLRKYFNCYDKKLYKLRKKLYNMQDNI